MSIEDNIRTVKEFFAATAQGDMTAVRALSADDIEWTIPGKDWPLPGLVAGMRGWRICLRPTPGRWRLH
jgi:ketosteroid isomerase-like protein